MRIGGLQKITLIDYPGKIAATVFLCSCNFRCPWCYSSEIVLPEKIKVQPKISQTEFFKFLKEKRGLIEGVVICGGEPTMSRELVPFTGKIKKMGFLVKLDTNGSDPKMLESLLSKKLVDYVAMDIKAPFDGRKYNKATGTEVDLEKIKKSAEIIKKSGVDYEFRTTVVPSIHSREDILQMAKDISPAKKYYLQNFRAEKTMDKKFESLKPYANDFLLEIQTALAPLFEICQIR